jgi:23S rRNA pseudouridine1911/1915/1917 synthase
MSSNEYSVSSDQAGMTLAAFLRAHQPGQSWSEARRQIEIRRARVGGELCLDPARRLKEGDVVQLLDRPAPRPRAPDAVTIRYLDAHLVVVEKPSGISTVRHPSERAWSRRRKTRSPTLIDLVPPLIALREKQATKGPPPRLRVVHRLDKGTSGLVVFARRVAAEQGLGRQFKAHTVVRRYLAVVPGQVHDQRIASRLVRDRGDGRRGSTDLPGVGKEAVTHLEVKERLPGYTLLSCRLETGRTHQIRIHLAELGHPVCGERVYQRLPGQELGPDPSGAPRLALHAVELGFLHPITGKALHWTMPLADDLRQLVDRLRGQ